MQYHESREPRGRPVADVWQADRFSVRERVSRSRRSPAWVKFRREWHGADFAGRALLSLYLAVCGLAGALAGLVALLCVLIIVAAIVG